MNSQTLITVVGFVTAGAVLLVGIAIVTGLLLPTYVPDNSRMIVGGVMIAYGVYRSIMLWVKHRSQKAQLSHEQQAHQ